MSAILSRPQCVKCLWHVRFGVNDHRSRSSRSFEDFVMVDPWFPACLLDLLHIWHKYKTCVAHHFQVKTQGLKGHWHFFTSSFIRYPMCGTVPIWPFHFIAQTQPMNTRCVAHTICGSKCQRSNPHRSFILCNVCSVAPCLFDRFASYMTQLQSMRGRYVTLHFHVKGQGHSNFSYVHSFVSIF